MVDITESPLRVSPVEGDRIDHYTVQSILGEGTFGTVYKVKDAQARIYALKLLRLFELYPVQARPNVVKRFKLEFETGKINSSYLAPTFSIGQVKGNPYFTMHYCPGGSMRNKAGLINDFSQINKFGIEILKGLKDLHTNGKIHRDLKPDNVLIDETGKARLTDFGIAGHLNLEQKEASEGRVRLTTTDILGRPKERFGSYPYMPPEQLKPTNRLVTKLPANDIFSFGVTMFEIITGHLPFGHITSDAELAEYIRKVTTGQFARLNDFQKNIPEVWGKIMEKSLHPDFRLRFQNVDEILSLLGAENAGYKQLTIQKGIQLVIMQGEEPNRSYNLDQMLNGTPFGLLRIGRCDIGVKNQIEVLDDHALFISRHHATIEKQQNNTWYIRDGQWLNKTNVASWVRSTNGTYLNGKEVDDRGAQLHINDIITLGETTLKVIDA